MAWIASAMFNYWKSIKPMLTDISFQNSNFLLEVQILCLARNPQLLFLRLTSFVLENMPAKHWAWQPQCLIIQGDILQELQVSINSLQESDTVCTWGLSLIEAACTFCLRILQFLKLYLFSLYVHTHVRGQLAVVSPYRSEDQTQAIRLGSKHSYPLSEPSSLASKIF